MVGGKKVVEDHVFVVLFLILGAYLGEYAKWVALAVMAKLPLRIFLMWATIKFFGFSATVVRGNIE